MTREQALKIVTELKIRLSPIYGDRMKRLIAYGSQVRGDAKNDSDFDVAIVLKPCYDFNTEWNLVAELLVDFDIENGIVTDIRFVSDTDWDEGTFALHRAMKREGVAA